MQDGDPAALLKARKNAVYEFESLRATVAVGDLDEKLCAALATYSEASARVLRKHSNMIEAVS